MIVLSFVYLLMFDLTFGADFYDGKGRPSAIIIVAFVLTTLEVAVDICLLLISNSLSTEGCYARAPFKHLQTVFFS